MEWQVRIKDHKDQAHMVDLPGYLLARTVIPLVLDKRPVTLRWHDLHQSFFVCEEGSSLERCLQVRNCSIDYDPETDEKRIRFHLASKDATIVEAIVLPLSHSRAVRSKVKKKRASKQYSPLTGKVTKLYIKVGDVVQKGDQVAVVEAMKMENKILSEMAGIVTEVKVSEMGLINMGDEIFSTSSLKTQAK